MGTIFADFLEKAVGIVWNFPVIGLCLFTGLFFSLRFGFIQLRAFPHAIALLRGRYDDPSEKGHITHFQALMAALSGTIGLGNIAGVAIAIAIGGPGAVLWMWIVGFFGMATKFVECTLGTYYRDEDPVTGEVRGGPMYYITKGLGPRFKPMAFFYATCIMFGAFGAGGMFQSNQAANALETYFGVSPWVTGLALALCVALVIIGGIKRIGQVASKIVPTMCIIYVLGSVYICLLNITLWPVVLKIILHDAFTGTAAAGGLIGAVIIAGVRRAVFSNEAGLGSASIAHAAVKTNYPIREGIVAAMGPFIDTIVVCSATATVIILSGNFGTEMYRNTSAKTITFENTQVERTIVGPGWTVSSDKIPKLSNKLHRHIDGKFVLAYDGKSAETSALTERIILSEDTEAIAFSSYRSEGAGEFELRVWNKKNQKLATFPIVEKDLTFFLPVGDRAPLMTMTGSKPGQWERVFINIHPRFMSWIEENAELSELRIEFRAITPGQTWLVDRIQPVKKMNGIGLTIASFDRFFKGFGTYFISFAVVMFAFSTMITWSYYGEVGATFAFSKKSIPIFRWAFIALIFVGSITTLNTVMNFTDLMIGLMVIPNTIAILLLSGKVAGLSKDYFSKLKSGKIKPFK